MEKHFNAIYKIDELIKEICNKNEKNNDLINLFMNDRRVTNDEILFLYSRYYIKNKAILKDTTKESDIIIKFIESNYQKQEKLVSAFYSNPMLVLKLIRNYIEMGNVIEKDLEIVHQLRKEEIVKMLDPDYNIISVKYQNEIIRKEIMRRISVNNFSEGHILTCSANFYEAPTMWMPIILSDAYIFAKHLQKDKHYASLIEEYDFDILVQLFRHEIGFYQRTVSYAVFIRQLSAKEYVQLFDKAEKNKKTYQTIKKINPFYLLDKIDLENKRKQIKSIKY